MCVGILILSAKERTWPSVGDWRIVTSEKKESAEAMWVGPFELLQHKDISSQASGLSLSSKSGTGGF